MAELKPGWQRVKFGDVVRLNKESCKDPEAEGIERVIGLEHLEPGDLRIRSWADVADGTTFTKRVRPGQVLFGKRRAYQRKVAVADFEAVCSGDIYVFESADPESLHPGLLPFICKSEAFFSHAVDTSAGSLSPRTNWSSLKSCKIALPPLSEQRQIAALLKAATATLETSRAVVASARELRSSAIDELVHVAMATSPLALLQDMIDPDRPITYGILKPGKGHPNGVPVIKVRDYPAGEIQPESLLLTSPEIDQEYRRSRLRPGDLLISIRGTVGRLAFVPDWLDGANITQDTARLSIREGLSPIFVRCLLESSCLRSQIKASTTGLAVQGINIGELRRLKVPLASPEIQRRIEETWEASTEAVRAASAKSNQSALLLSSLASYCLLVP